MLFDDGPLRQVAGTRRRDARQFGSEGSENVGKNGFNVVAIEQPPVFARRPLLDFLRAGFLNSLRRFRLAGPARFVAQPADVSDPAGVGVQLPISVGNELAFLHELRNARGGNVQMLRKPSLRNTLRCRFLLLRRLLARRLVLRFFHRGTRKLNGNREIGNIRNDRADLSPHSIDLCVRSLAFRFKH